VRAWLLLLSLTVIGPNWDGPGRLDLLDHQATISAKPVPLDPTNPANKRVGRLTYLGGVELSSRDAVFGGFSGMRLDGNRFTLISDGGGVVRFRLDPYGRLSDVRIAELPAGPGTGWEKADRDSESMTVDAATGDVLIGFERSNEIWRYDAAFSRAIRHSAPPAMALWEENGGPEAMVRLKNGRTIVIAESETPPNGTGRLAVSFAGDPTAQPNRGFNFVYQPPAGFDPSDAALLPDGRILLLNRNFAAPVDFTTKLTIVDPRRIRPGATVIGEEIATIAAPLNRDNFEGLAVTQQGGDTIVWIISDNNQFLLERTLLMKFRLEAAAPRTR
jgi:hypothetical protein